MWTLAESRRLRFYSRNNHYSLAWYFPLRIQAICFCSTWFKQMTFPSCFLVDRRLTEVKQRTFTQHRASHSPSTAQRNHSHAVICSRAWELRFFFFFFSFQRSTFHSFTFELVWFHFIPLQFPLDKTSSVCSQSIMQVKYMRIILLSLYSFSFLFYFWTL